MEPIGPSSSSSGNPGNNITNGQLEKLLMPRDAVAVLKDMNLNETYSYEFVMRLADVVYRTTVTVNGNVYYAIADVRSESKLLAAQRALDDIIVDNLNSLRLRVGNGGIQNVEQDYFPWITTLPYVYVRYIKLLHSLSVRDDIPDFLDLGDFGMEHEVNLRGVRAVGWHQLELEYVPPPVYEPPIDIEVYPIRMLYDREPDLKFVEFLQGAEPNLKFGSLVEFRGEVFYSVESNKKEAKKAVCRSILRRIDANL